MILPSDALVPAKADAITVWPIRFVRPASVADKGLLEHEAVHAQEQMLVQFLWWWVLAVVAYRGAPILPWLALAAFVPLWWVPYLLVPSFRLEAEVTAYRRQIEVGGITVDRAATFLSDPALYRLDIDHATASRLLSNSKTP